MASIVKRKSKYSVVYTCTDENGVKRQKWETFASQAEAKKRKAQVEYQQSMNGYDPAIIGYVWDNDNPRIQLEPRGVRGYIELRAIKLVVEST